MGNGKLDKRKLNKWEMGNRWEMRVRKFIS
jgi:hypothetical protein